ncbi:M20 family metallo-hydrolase [Aequorivita sp. Q41]|uniref:M20 family metallo-hydrolase n=1 Tax=Aequorivita sp. Q41 TaxID=3153300 RepID=UPI0032425A11
MKIVALQNEAISLLHSLIETPSFSEEEDQTAIRITTWLQHYNIPTQRYKNNIWAQNKMFDSKKPTVLLNSHHDTVKPNKAYTNDPFKAFVKDGKLYGLGSNDAGGCLVSLMALFVYFYDKKDLKYNLIIVASAEEENSGNHGLNSILPKLPEIDFAVVGEPTQMQLAVAEKGLLVVDAYAPGIAGHAAHDNTENAIYNALEDILWIKNYNFPKHSEALGKIKMNVTQIEAGEQHNVVPATCHFVVDIRITDAYTNREVFNFLQANTKSELKARSFRLNSSAIPLNHPIVKAGIALGRNTYGSPTLSDQAVLSCPSLKMGPGDSTRSHSADEFIYMDEIKEGIEIYINLFNKIL